jgi:hypothetical protein
MNPLGYAVVTSVGGLLSTAVGLGFAASRWPGAGPWAVLGSGLIVVVSVATGTWLVAQHGRPGWGFLAALGAGVVGRLVASAAGGAAVAFAGGDAACAYATGLVAAFVPLQAVELAWFSGSR